MKATTPTTPPTATPPPPPTTNTNTKWCSPELLVKELVAVAALVKNHGEVLVNVD